MKRSTLSRLTVGAMVMSAGLVLPTGAQAQTAETVSKAAAATAVGIGLDIDADVLTPLPVPRTVQRYGDAYQTFPPGAAAPAEKIAIDVPSSAAANADTASGMAGATGAPQAVASGEAQDVQLINSNPQAPVITADVVRGQSNSDCVNDPNGAGTIITGLKVNGTEVLGGVNGLFPPNYEAPGVKEILAGLGVRLIINEQRPAANGRGFVVNALHLFDIEPNSAGTVLDGDIRVGHAETTVNCPNGRGSTGLTSNIVVDKDASVASAAPGSTFSYTLNIQNKAAAACRVNQLVDHLAPPFEFVSTSGDLGTVATTAARSGGITDVIIKTIDKTIAAGGSITQTYVVKVKDDAVPGTYFNSGELLCTGLGNFLFSDAPVTVPGAGRLPQCSDKVDNDGDGKIDFPADPGCSSAQDDSEIDFECSDRIDNDGDGKIDFPADPGCSSATDDSETNSLPRTGADGAVAIVGGALLIGAAVTARKLKWSR